MGSETAQLNFCSLMVRDLLEAREAYHAHLLRLDNVFATAIGLYRMHREDPSTQSENPKRQLAYGESLPRTLANTVVRSWSWPCVLLFVDRWYTRTKLKAQPQRAAPRFLYLPDGRVVPTCVILAPRDLAPEPPVERLVFTSSRIGGGYTCISDSQGIERIGTIASLVTREGTLYALTNRHVVGLTGQPIHALVKGMREQIGTSSPVHAQTVAFSEVYPMWPGAHSLLRMDAGLIRVSDANQWTSQVFGVGEIGPLEDMNCHTITLNLIGRRIRAFCGVSGSCEGEIHALFYRYRSVGGFDYVADLLIGAQTERDGKSKRGGAGGYGPRSEPVARPGDSGSLVFLESEKEEQGERARRLRPLAMIWGGERLKSGKGRPPSHFALATFLSTIYRVLDIEVVGDWSVGYREYWGKSGHFKIGWAFCNLLSTAKLRSLFLANRDRIGFPDASLELGRTFTVDRRGYVPLADVPDYVWVPKAMRSRRGGPRENELAQHFADIDQAAPDDSPSLLDLCRIDTDANLRARVWREFYRKFENYQGARPEAGMLPFRVRQIYEEMVRFLERGRLKEFVAAAGVLAHYVGDSCIPLHLSYLHHGYGPDAPRNSDEYREYKKSREYKIHSIFEQGMFERRPAEMLMAINRRLRRPRRATVRGGAEAIRLVFRLMDRVCRLLPPEDIIAADDPTGTQPERAVRLFGAVGDRAAQCVALGCLAQAKLIESAWREGRGGRLLPASGAPPTFPKEDLKRLYYGQRFLPALTLDKCVRRGH
ncbi:MAG: hypothetical protein V3W37_01905 [Candidatus Binatia bacterium]